MIIDKEEDLNKIDEFLEHNILFEISSPLETDSLYYEIKSIKIDKLRINKYLMNSDIFVKVMKKFIKSRDMLLDQDYRKISYYNINLKQGCAKIETSGYKCNITLFASTTNENVLVPTDREFLMKLLGLIDNGQEPTLIVKDNEFYLTFGSNLTIKYDRSLLKYIEEYVVDSKYSEKFRMKLERKK